MVNFINDIAFPLSVFVGSIFAYLLLVTFLSRKLLKKSKTKSARHNIIIFTKLLIYLFVIIAVILLIFYYTGNVLAFGLTAGFLTAALGWALQRPITGIAGWIMVVIKKPFRIGDRIFMGGVKGDVMDITLTHIYLKEIGGTINAEETSGRVILIPNSIMFEQNIINYTIQDEFILDEVSTTITYESNLDQGIAICEKAAKKIISKNFPNLKKEPYVRVNFQPSGIDVRVRYHVHNEERIRISSEITREIFNGFSKQKNVEIAYPHTEVVLRNKK